MPLRLLHCLEPPSWARVTILSVLTTHEEGAVALLLLLVLVLVLMLMLMPLLAVEKLVLFPVAPPAGLAPVDSLAGTPGPPMAGLASRLRQVKQPVRSEA